MTVWSFHPTFRCETDDPKRLNDRLTKAAAKLGLECVSTRTVDAALEDAVNENQDPRPDPWVARPFLDASRVRMGGRKSGRGWKE